MARLRALLLALPLVLGLAAPSGAGTLDAGYHLDMAAGTATMITHQRQIQRQIMKNNITHDLQSIMSAFDEELGDHVRDNPKTAVALAALAGFILADKIV